LNVNAIYNNFSVNNYTGADLEKLGVKLVQQVLNHIGMIRYNKTKIKEFDFNPKEIGQITDISYRVLSGVNIYKGLADYRLTMQDLVETIRDMKSSGQVKDSVKVSMRNSVATELRRFMSENLNFEEIWDI